MKAHELLEIGRIAATDHACHRDAGVNARPQHQPLAPPKAALAQRQPAEPVVDMRIDARVEEHQVRPHLIEQAWQVIGKLREIGVVLEPCVELDVQIAPLLVQREIDPAVHRESVHPGIPGKNRCRAVALMDVEIDHQSAVDAASSSSTRAATATSLKTQKPAP
jgi:hypothetical protein